MPEGKGMITSRFPMSQPRFIAAVNSDCEKSFAEGNGDGAAAIAFNTEFGCPNRAGFHATNFTAKGMHIKMGETPIIELKNIAVSFDGEAVLKDFNLSIQGGEFVTLLGPSGCGKTTTLRIVGGFVNPDKGDVFFNGKRINDVPPHKREVNTIFQKYALFPHLNVYDNVAFGMRVHGKSEKEIQSTVKEMLNLVNLNGFAHRNVNLLSGGTAAACRHCSCIGKQPQGVAFG